MQVISFLNMKGGVGKTTLAVNIAYALAWVHKKIVLVVDADPQFNATQYLLGADEYLSIWNQRRGLCTIFFSQSAPGRSGLSSGQLEKSAEQRCLFLTARVKSLTKTIEEN